MSGITFDQIRGPVERLVYIGLGWLVARGFITSADVANYATLALAIIAAFYGWWQNRPKAIIQSAAAILGDDGKRTVVVTSPKMAASTQENNIVSNKAPKNSVSDAVTANT